MRIIGIGVILLAGLISGCGAGADAPVSAAPPLARTAPDVQFASFAAWKQDFRGRAIASGIRPQVFDTALSGVGINPEVERLDGQQAEFTKPLWAYLDGAASADRVGTGRAKRSQLAPTLTAIEDRYGVDQQVVLAIWGMETNYGSYRGSIPVVESLATLSYEGRRRAWAEEELLGALRILQAGDATPQQMVGSWAGAMGHTQFIPSSYLEHAVDFDGDGRRDVWGTDPTDALASTANYLRANGWRRGQPWGVEVRLPAGFDFAAADQSNRQPVGYWRSRGVTTVAGAALPDHGTAAVIAPAGANGPAFALYENFFVIKTYNNATSYTIGVAHLGDRIMGGGPIQRPWPRHERELSRSEKVEMQERLMARGYDTGKTDGIVGPDTIRAIRQYQAAQGLVPDGFANAALLAKLRS